MRRRGVWVVVMVALGVVAMALAAVGAATTLAALAWLRAGTATANRAGTQVALPPAGKVFTRDEFRQLMEGKTEAEVLKLLGTPTSTYENVLGTKFWKYRGLTTDPVTGKTDDTVDVRIQHGVVAGVSF